MIGPSWVGDMMMSQSLYRTLKARYPQAIIDVMAPAWCRPLLIAYAGSERGDPDAARPRGAGNR
ncbi:hypothetical protein ACVT18_02975 [Klebsiella pneumoniae]